MPILNSMMIMSPSIQNYSIDKTNAAALSGGIVYFYKDTARTVLKPIYQQAQLPNNTYVYNQLANPMQLSASGTPVDQNGNDINIWLFPFEGTPTLTNKEIEYYYVEVYSAGGVLQETRSAWPGPVAVAGATDTITPTDNLLTNPQFSAVNFDPIAGYTYAAPVGTSAKNIAPGWDIVTNGSGNVTVTRLDSILTNVPSNPPYILNILTSAFAADIQLRQRLYFTPKLFLGTNVAGYFAAASTGSAVNLTMQLIYSGGNPLTFTVASLTTPLGGAYIDTSGVVSAVAVAQTTPNPDLPAIGYVDLIINIPRNTQIQISSLQICAVPASTQEVLFLPQTVQIETDHTFHYFQPRINFKPIPSLLVGWDFPLNPAQFLTPATITTVPAYVLDQTIMAISSATASISRDTNSKALVCTSAAPNQAFYMLQYLSDAQAIETTLSNLSVNLSAMSLVNPGVTARVYLYYSSAGGTIPLLTNPPATATIGTVDGAGVFTLGAGGTNWTEIQALTGQARSGILTQNTVNDLGFNGFNGLANYRINAVNNFAIVVTFQVPTSGTQVVINSCSVVPGDIPTRPAPQTIDQVLRECRYYYEKTYPAQTALTTQDEVSSPMDSFNVSSVSIVANLYCSPFSQTYSVSKRTTATVIIYNPLSGVSNNLFGQLFHATTPATIITTNVASIAVSACWTITQFPSGFFATPINAGSLASPATSGSNHYSSGRVVYHYSADARLGVV